MEAAFRAGVEGLFAGIGQLDAGRVVMLALGCLLLYLAIERDVEPLLLLPIGFGALLVNIPGADLMEPGGVLRTFYDTGVLTEVFPVLVFIGIGAMTDFGPLLENPKILLLGAAGQFGIFFTLLLALALGFTVQQSTAIGVIGAMDGPTAIYVASRFAPDLLGPISVAAYSYMSLVPIIQPPIMRLLTTEQERGIVMGGVSRTVSRRAKLSFPVMVVIVGSLIAPQGTPLLGTEAMSLDEALKRLRRQWRAATHVAAGPRPAESDADALKREILEKVRQYHAVAHGPVEFHPGRSRVGYAGRVFGPEEMVNLVDASLDFWLTLGPWGDRFEQSLRQRLGARDVALVNSGSSANLVAVTAITSPNLEGGLQPGDEVITPAVTFPTTLAPILQNRLVPVLVDCQLGTYNLDPELVEEAIGRRTRAILAPHTLGNPFAVETIREIAVRHHLLLIEDCCDALGSLYDGQPCGSFGDLATISFFPAHHITMGEGGAVVSNRSGMSRIVRSLRDWGRDCWCAPGESNTCGKRFGWQLGDLPAGYDHKFTYTHVGYNLKPTDMQAAIGVAQLDRLDGFIARRRENFTLLYEGLKLFEDRLVLPQWDPRGEPAWFGFPLTVRDGMRSPLVHWLEEGGIETRDMFGGQILRQPAYKGAAVRVPGTLEISDQVAESTFFLGVYPGLTRGMIEYVLERFGSYFARH